MLRAAVFALLAAAGCSSDSAPGFSPWMKPIADDTMLSAMSIPGTHDSGALHEPLAGTAQDQQLDIADQLTAGVRYFDIRCRELGSGFEIYHGPVDEEQTFDQVLAAMTAFLTSYPSEAVMMSVKEEDPADNTTYAFDQVFGYYVDRAPGLFYLDDSVPALGDVRGRITLVRRFDTASTPLGIDASGWQDDTTFTLTDTDATLRIQDNYEVSDNNTKWADITELLSEAQSGPATTLYLNYTSGYQTVSGLPNIPDVADAIDPMLIEFLTDPANANTRVGVLAMDLVDGDQVGNVVALDSALATTAAP